MKKTTSMPRPPITQLRPLHSHQQPSNQGLETPWSGVKNHLEEDLELLHWPSSLEPKPDKDTCTRAFVKLVSRIVVLDPSEAYCIQDSTRGGFILARSVGAGHEDEGEDGAFSFVDCTEGQDVPTDFSIDGKALQLHLHAGTRQVRLTAQANVIPPAALEALGRMLDDLMLGLQQGQGKGGKWSQPSVLNFPPKSRPLPLGVLSERGSDENVPALLHRWFEQCAAGNPDRTALDFLVCLESGKRIQYTYLQVENAANALAANLVRTSQSQSQPSIKTVAVLMGPCPELYISYLAALKAGMAFCPIPVDAPEERRGALMTDLKPAALLVAASTQPSWLLSSTAISVTPYLAACDAIWERPSPCATETDVAYIIYTSGTTGMPKGVAVSHISAACTVSALSAHCGFVSSTSSEPIRWFQGAAPTFDISLFEIFWTLSTGSTLCCAPRELTLQHIDKVVTTLEVDITNMAPSIASLLDPSSIRGLMLGGETVNTRLLRDFAHYNHERGHIPSGIYNGYGPTETAIYCIAQAHVPEEQRGSVLGTPLATCGGLIVDERLQTRGLEPVPMGATGELVITGPQVSRAGYLNRPDETARAFIDDARWGRAYRTGDRARIVWGPRGEPMVEFLGRISDHQVKLSGRRVELGEIESVLASSVAGVQETLSCVWKPQSSEAGSEKVVSLVVLAPRADLAFELVHQRCLEATRRHLPDYMRPIKILQVDELPKSASGKADRKAASAYVRKTLKQDHQPRPSGLAQDEHVGPLSDPEDAKLEDELLSIVSGILGHGSAAEMTVTATTPLVEAGMDSLRAMKLLRHVRKRWPTSASTAHHHEHARLQPSLARLLDAGASVRSVFFTSTRNVHGSTKVDANDADTVSRLADFSSRYLSEALDKLNLAREADIEMVLPATCTQSQLAVSFAMDRRNYVSDSVLRLKPDVSAETLKDAVETVVSEQAIYRCAMLPCDDSLSPFVQVILAPEAWHRLVHNVSRVVHRRASASRVAGDAKPWLDLAEENMSLESQRLYHIQVVESDSDSEPGSSTTGLLVVSVAHCICDGASLEVLMSDIARRYAGLEPLPRQGIYEAVLDWASNVDSETDRLWRESLKGWETESFGALSGSIVKPSADCGHGMVQHASDLPWQALEDRSRALGASPLSILQASWSLLLHRFSEADTGDVTFGSVISGHHLSAHAPTFSVVPCRVALPEMQTVSQLVGSLARHSRFAQSHRHTSFGIFKTLPYNTALALQAYPRPDPEPEHGLGEAVPVLWTEIRNPAVRYNFAIFVEVFPTDPHSPDRNGQFNNMTFKLTYRENALSQLSATCILKQLATLTETMLGSLPDGMAQGLPARLPRSLLSAEGTIPVLPTKDKEDGNQKSQGRVEPLHSQFESQASSTPDLLALSFYTSIDSPPVELSYAELDAKANGLAETLREEDVGIIPICMHRSVELYVAVLAILKAGSAWCPIDETSPVQRRASLIARTQSKVLLTTTESLPLVEPCLAHQSLAGVRVILVDQHAHQKMSVRADPRHGVLSWPDITGQDLAYLLWTSGTTGEPKGVMIQHAAAAQAMRDLQIQVEHDETTGQVRTLQLSSYSFDVFVQDLFYTWGLAGSVVSGTRELVLGKFVEFIWKCRPTHAHLTPSFGASIAVDDIRGSTLQYVTFIGEKLTEDVAEAWAAPGITTRAYNTYGPAENAVVSTLRRFCGRSRDRAKAANVGLPLKHCTSYVVREIGVCQDEQKSWGLVPRYGVGELALGGAQVAKGYLGDEAKTAKAFIQGGPGIDQHIYLTGDMVRLNDHGFEFLGRNDDLVKMAGIRIELSEISAACASVKDEEAAVEHVETLYLLRPGADTESNNKVVVTVVSVKDIVDTGKIRVQVFRRARDLLPKYMVPGHVVVLDTTMPRTVSNKVDRNALQEIYRRSNLNVLAGTDGPEQSTGDGLKTKLQWTEQQIPVLQAIADNFMVAVEPLSPGDSLAGLGFSSVQVTKLAWSLRRQLKCVVGVLDLMRCQVLGELIDVVVGKLPGQQAILAQSSGSISPETPAENSWVASTRDMLTRRLRGDMRPHDTSYVLPTTPMQESLIVETMLEPRAYWAHRVFDLSHLGEIDGRRLEKAWTAAARRFDILRTIFVPLTQLDVQDTEEHDSSVVWARQQGIQSTILQLVRDEATVRWTRLSSDKDQDLARWAEKLQMELAPTTTTQPPWSVTLAEGAGKMMLSMHHALYDSVSSEILLDTVARLYQNQIGHGHDGVVQFERGMELGLLPTASQRDEAASLWNSRLADLRKTAGALNAPFPDLTQSRQRQPQRILLSRMTIPPWLATSKSPALPTLLQSAFGCVLASYLELKAVVFGQTVSQRSLHPGLARVMGPAMATLPVIVRADSPSAEELWSDMTRDSSSLLRGTHSLHPVDVKKMLNQGSGSGNAPFPGLFVYHPTLESAQDAEDNTVRQMFREVEQALSLNVEHPLALNIFEDDGAMELTGDGRRISQAQLELMLHQVIDQARVMVESPQLPLDRLQNRLGRSLVSISGEAAADEVRAVDPTESISLHASEHPEWIAAEELMFQGSGEDEDEIVTKTITYSQLDRLTDATASRLASHEIRLRPDDIVAMHMGRDIKSLAAILAIFRAGYVYLPVDAHLPPARKRLVVRDAQAKLVVTTEELAGDLDLNLDSDPPALLLPDGDDDVDVMLSWPVSPRQLEAGHGGYLVYTSGSTGRPKGVRVSNSNLCHFIESFIARMVASSPATATLEGAGKYLTLASRAFDPHLTQVFVPWHLGHRVVIGKDRTAILGRLQQVINELGITHFGSVPSVLTQVGLRPDDVPSVRVVTTGGEKASSELLDTWTKGCDSADRGGHQQHVVLFNFYGPTEVTVGCLGHAVNRDSNARNLGLPLQGLEALLLCPGTGDEQVIARRGQPGELCIAGPQVAMGYLDRPMENAKSFRTTSLLGDGDKRVYRTGDMMRMMHDGSLEFLGRADQQAKIRGQRLELDEVVSFLKEAAADEGGLDFAAAVVARGNAGSDQQQQLLGFAARQARILLKAEADAEVELLQNHGQALTSLLERIEHKCEAALPAFMVPTMLWVSRIPYLAASGKVDTKLLAKLADDFFASQHGQQDRDVLASATAADPGHSLDARESVIVAAVEEAVGGKINATATSGIHSLGIDSLSAVHLVSLLRKRGFPKLNMADILSSSCTVGSTARLADRDFRARDSTGPHGPSTSPNQQALSTADLGPVPDISQIEAVLPCLPLQSALVARSLVWLGAFGDGDEEGRTAVDVPYVAQFHYRLSRGTDVARWKKAAELAVASEAMLRTCFVQREDDGRILQVVLRSPPFSPFDGQGDAADMAAQMNVRPPIMLRVGDTEHSGETVVSLKIHHALFDAVAIDVLRKRLERGYDGQEPLSASANKSLNVLRTISGYCCLSDGQIESTRCLWQARLRGVRPCRVGADSDNNKHGTMARSMLCLACTTPQLKAKLQAQSKQSGVSISAASAFQLAMALCLAQVTRQTSVVYGFVMSLRPLLNHVVDGVDDFVGPCLNTLVQTASLQGGDETLPELAQRVQEAHVGACQGTMPLVSVDRVQRWAGSEDRLFDSLLSINLVPAEVAADGEPKPGRMGALRARSRSDMALAVDVDLHADGKIVLTLSSAGALTESQLDHVGKLFDEVVCSSADNKARVEHFVPMLHDANAVAPGGGGTPNDSEPEAGLAEDGYQEALACVQTAARRLLRLKPSDMPVKTKTTSLYYMGLDSITVLPFIKLVNKSENIKLTPDAVIKARTIQGVARLVRKAKTRTGGAVNCGGRRDSEARRDKADDGINVQDMYDKTLERLAKDLVFVATPLQEGMLSASLAIAAKAYTHVHTIQLSEEALRADTPNLDNFFAAVGDTVQACEILRARFIFTQDDDAPWIGVVSPTEQSDLVHWEAVNTDLPGRVQLRIHHALYDAHSLQAMWRILGENYRRRLQGHDQDGGEAARHLFRPFARTSALAQRASVTFWANLVQDYSYAPLDFSGDSLQASSAFCFALGEQELSFLQARCRALGVTTKAALQLAWAKVLCESLYGQADVVYGEVVSTSGEFDCDATVGPTINTVPMRVRLADRGIAVNVAGALAMVQKLCDNARGTHAMASLRKIQTLWRWSSRDQERVSASLFQTLFVFDGVMASVETDGDDSTQPLFGPVCTQTQRIEGDSDNGPAYDDYPLIVSFRIKNNSLQGKLRAKMTTKEVETLGSRLDTAVRCVVSCELQSPALDFGHMETAGNKNLAPTGRGTCQPVNHLNTDSLTSMADAVLEVVKTVLGTRRRGKDIGYNTRLVNVGLDSILAIRLSRLLRKQMGMSASVFEMIKGASVHDMVTSTTPTPKIVMQGPRQQLSTRREELKGLVAKILGLPRGIVKSVLPVLAGQRAHLEQWLYNGKRFFEAPWVYRVVDDSLDRQKVASCWAELCRVHDALRTTFVWTGSATGLAQVTMGEQWTGEGCFAALQDLTRPIEALIDEHCGGGNDKPSDLRKPPARLLYLEALDGKAVVLRVHHALYDAWSIKMIEKDLDELLAFGKVLQTRASFERVLHQIRDIRRPGAEDSYWKHHLSHAQDTVLYAGAESGASSAFTTKSPLGPHFKVGYSAVVPQSTVDALSRTKSNVRTSAAIILAYARTLGRFTKRSRPTFGLSHASRSLCSVDGAQTLDLTAASVPTLTVTPLCVDLDVGSHRTSPEEHLLDFVQDHLAQLTKFAQSDGVTRFCPRFNSYINILYPGDKAAGAEAEHVQAATRALSRHRLREPLASNYFTVTEPSSSTVSTIEELDTSHLCPHRFFLNVTVHQGHDVTAVVSGDDVLRGGDPAMVTKFVSYFGSELANIIEGTCAGQFSTTRTGQSDAKRNHTRYK